MARGFQIQLSYRWWFSNPAFLNESECFVIRVSSLCLNDGVSLPPFEKLKEMGTVA